MVLGSPSISANLLTLHLYLCILISFEALGTDIYESHLSLLNQTSASSLGNSDLVSASLLRFNRWIITIFGTR